jgi:hypothetical protein
MSNGAKRRGHLIEMNTHQMTECLCTEIYPKKAKSPMRFSKIDLPQICYKCYLLFGSNINNINDL